MATKPIVFKPTLNTPQGINNYSGEIFRCFTKGDTLPFRFTFSNSNGVVDVTGWKVYIVMSDITITDYSNCSANNSTVIEVEIPLADLDTAIFEGVISDRETQALPTGIIYAMAKYVTPAGGTIEVPIPAYSYIIDMCVLEAYPNILNIYPT